MITNVSERQFDTDASVKRPGIVGHIVQDGEDLWSLAKKYMTTVSGIMEVNSMDNENVKTGDKVTLNQVIGRLSNSDDSDDCVLHFEIWKETENLNPEQWLRR